MVVEEGTLIWWEETQQYVKATSNCEIFIPLEEIHLSEVRKEDRTNLLQAIWSRQKGSVSQRIGYSEKQDQEIAKTLGVW
ncbi:hypothetical protein [Candidatus Enterococcus willemsii]|uniref:Uncharacterized protein n=1 Tax=Candidatus Enterococcus willemsii TaxID=1857215 RepID=A0ABQ6YWE3_9ENTE|nr:hypothetical protein [Enterococcus sp. CU12B]KAF1301446.1 hypothetical protein BAU17_05850 [Enterococcus sp. CU12B]